MTFLSHFNAYHTSMFVWVNVMILKSLEIKGNGFQIRPRIAFIDPINFDRAYSEIALPPSITPIPMICSLLTIGVLRKEISLMKNIEMTVEGETLVVKVDLSKDFGPSKSGKTIIVASTEGNVSVPDRDEKIGLNIYRYPVD